MHDFLATHSYVIHLPVPLWALLVAALWTIVLKGLALWYSARAGQKAWFVALLVINTLGILEVVYLLFFRPTSFEVAERPAGGSSAGA